ncbi:MAG TPA: hypothetical protein DCY15_06540 [Ruminococcaceae bacterium]|nr:hypothetical protein [Oscillospiraceae bacterium]
MMNKTDYIREVDELHAPDSLKDKISQLKPTRSAKPKKGKRITAIIAACLAVAVLVGGAYGAGSSLSKNKSTNEIHDESSYIHNYSNGSSEDTIETGKTNGSPDGTNPTSQKLIKTASVSIETKNADELIKKINAQVGSVKGYTSSLSQSKHGEYMTIETAVNVPAEKLDEFIEYLEKAGTITARNIRTSDVTNDYTDTESQITALETEEKALLGILAKCETVQDTMDVQDRLAQVRGELESLRSQKKNYDQRIAYSEISISISEVERVKKNPSSFGSQVSEKFSESLYNIGQFFRNLGIFVLGASPYLVIAAVVIAVVIIIVKKKRNKK